MRRWWYISAVMWMLAGSLPVGCMMTGCKGACGSRGTCGGTRQASCGLGDVRQTLAVADSMRVNHGVAYDDSLALAEAYDAFGRYRIVYPDDYARACYYYGRMLRNRGDYVSAMQAFISGTHAPYVQRVVPLPWFSNHAILGRIYSNMGTMCHRKNEFELSCQMYEQSSAQFLQAGDTISYFYALNAMALQLAEQKKHDETLVLLNDIEDNCSYSAVLNKIWETKAILYFNLAQYDSTIYSVKQLQARGNHESTGYVKEAQAFWELHQYDSAVYYARIVLEHPAASEPDRYNMLYILSNNNSEKNIKHVQELSSERADIDKEILDPLHEQLALSVELLRQDLNKKPYSVNIGLLLFYLFFVGCVACGAFVLIKRHRQRSIDAIETKHQEVYDQLRVEIENNCKLLRKMQNIETELAWEQHQQVCEMADKHFNLLANKLRALDVLNEREIHLCILVMIGGFTDKQLANMLSYGTNSIRSIKLKTANKLGTTSSNLSDFLIEKAVHGIEKLP